MGQAKIRYVFYLFFKTILLSKQHENLVFSYQIFTHSPVLSRGKICTSLKMKGSGRGFHTWKGTFFDRMIQGL